jgi:hypothetical protein
MVLFAVQAVGNTNNTFKSHLKAPNNLSSLCSSAVTGLTAGGPGRSQDSVTVCCVQDQLVVERQKAAKD